MPKSANLMDGGFDLDMISYGINASKLCYVPFFRSENKSNVDIWVEEFFKSVDVATEVTLKDIITLYHRGYDQGLIFWSRKHFGTDGWDDIQADRKSKGLPPLLDGKTYYGERCIEHSCTYSTCSCNGCKTKCQKFLYFYLPIYACSYESDPDPLREADPLTDNHQITAANIEPNTI